MRNILLHLSLIEKVGPATIDKLVTAFSCFNHEIFDHKNFDYKNNYKSLLLNIYDLSLKDLIYYSKLKESTANLIYKGLKDKTLLDQELALIDKYDVKIINIFDQDYPRLLKEIYLPPTILYVKAHDQFKFSDNSIAIVGSRKCDNYGSRVVKSIVPDLINNRYDIISGGAYGIDTIAHQESINSSGRTVCILGSGLLRLYPRENKKLFEQIILNGGALISPFSLNTSAHPGNFPVRNRIISGLSMACVVVQSQEKSGALITAHYALEQGREVLAVPGPIDNSLSSGCHKLISQGAQLVTCAQDILTLLGNPVITPKPSLENVEGNTIFKDNNLNDIEIKILDLLQNPLSLDELLMYLELSFDQIQDILFDMQVKCYITQNMMGLWQKI